MVRKTKSYLVFFQFDQYAEIKIPKDMQPAATRAPRGMEDEVTIDIYRTLDTSRQC